MSINKKDVAAILIFVALIVAFVCFHPHEIIYSLKVQFC